MAKKRATYTAAGVPAARASSRQSDSPSAQPEHQLETLVVTHAFDPSTVATPYSAIVRVIGRRASVSGRSAPTDSFVHDERIDRIVPGSGPISVTSRVNDLVPGEWSVAAELIKEPPPSAASRPTRRGSGPQLRVANWSWRHSRLETGGYSAVVHTRLPILARLSSGPRSFQGSIAPLVLAGTFLTLYAQSSILAQQGLDTRSALFVTAIAALGGLVAAKTWYARLNPGSSLLWGGWAVDGFLVVAPLIAITALLVLHFPLGAWLDATTPGFFLTVSLGRVGCFFTGCCSGRTSSARWAVWSSDGRVCARRVPTQLLESVTGLALALLTLPVALARAAPAGFVFIGAFGAYLIARQLLLRLRSEPRSFSWSRHRRPSRLPDITK